MAHAIQVLIVSERDAKLICDVFRGAKRTKAGAGRWLIPLTSTFGAAANDVRHLDLEEATADDVGYAFEAALAVLGSVEALEPAVVAATEYFGGVGSHSDGR